jgi:hypothetical protein
MRKEKACSPELGRLWKDGAEGVPNGERCHLNEMLLSEESTFAKFGKGSGPSGAKMLRHGRWPLALPRYITLYRVLHSTNTDFLVQSHRAVKVVAKRQRIVTVKTQKLLFTED